LIFVIFYLKNVIKVFCPYIVQFYSFSTINDDALIYCCICTAWASRLAHYTFENMCLLFTDICSLRA